MKARFAVGLLFLLPALLFALGEESFGNAPVPKQSDWAVGVQECVNHRSRVYRQWVNGNENFFHQGGTAAVNEALELYGRIAAKPLEVVLLPGAGKTKSFQGKEIDFDWKVHVPSGIYRARLKRTVPVMTIHIPARPEEAAFDAKAAAAWIEELDSPKFAVRENAAKQLAGLGNGARPLLRDALKQTGISAERKAQLERLLADRGGIRVDEMVIPKEVTVIDATDLIERARKELKAAEYETRAYAAHDLSGLARFDPAVIGILAEIVKLDPHEYPRRMAAYGLGEQGARATDTLPVLKACRDSAEKDLKVACEKAIADIEKAKPVDPEESKGMEATRKAIAKLKAGK